MTVIKRWSMSSMVNRFCFKARHIAQYDQRSFWIELFQCVTMYPLSSWFLCTEGLLSIVRTGVFVNWLHLSIYIYIRGRHEIWEALVLQTSNMVSTLVLNQMSTCPRWIKLICAINICSSIGRVSNDSHVSDKAKIAFRTIGRLFRRPLIYAYLIFTAPYILLVEYVQNQIYMYM